MADERPQRRSLARKSSAIKLSLSRSNTFTSRSDGDAASSRGGWDDSDDLSSSFPFATGQQTPSLPNMPPGALNVALENARALVAKRTATLEYLQRAHTGRAWWLNAILLTKDDINASVDPSRARIRTLRFAVLGMSLAPLLDIPSASDFLRAFVGVMGEYDALSDEKFERRLARSGGGAGGGSGKGRRRAASELGYSAGLGEEDSSLVAPNIPFELDYLQIFVTTCTILLSLYSKLSSFLGPSLAPSGFTAPSGFPQPPDLLSLSTLSLSSSTSAGLSPALVDLVGKIDTRVRKITQQITKDVDTIARVKIRQEIEGLEEEAGGGGGEMDFGMD